MCEHLVNAMHPQSGLPLIQRLTSCAVWCDVCVCVCVLGFSCCVSRAMCCVLRVCCQVVGKWVEAAAKAGIPRSTSFALAATLGDPVKVSLGPGGRAW